MIKSKQKCFRNVLEMFTKVQVFISLLNKELSPSVFNEFFNSRRMKLPLTVVPDFDLISEIMMVKNDVAAVVVIVVAVVVVAVVVVSVVADFDLISGIMLARNDVAAVVVVVVAVVAVAVCFLLFPAMHQGRSRHCIDLILEIVAECFRLTG